MENEIAPATTAKTMDVAFWPLKEIIPYARNARKIPPVAVDKVAASIQEFGWRSADCGG